MISLMYNSSTSVSSVSIYKNKKPSCR